VTKKTSDGPAGEVGGEGAVDEVDDADPRERSREPKPAAEVVGELAESRSGPDRTEARSARSCCQICVRSGSRGMLEVSSNS
jgi:hypothetical protein